MRRKTTMGTMMRRAGRSALGGLLSWAAVASLHGASTATAATLQDTSRVARAAPERRLDGLTHSLRAASGAPGLAVAVADSSGVRVFGSGRAVVEHDVPVTAETRFRMASASKAVTATLLAALRDRGRIALDRPVGELLPGLPAHLHPVTPRQLAAHTSGIAGYAPGDSVLDLRHFEDARSALDVFAHRPLEFEPGARYGYTTFGYTLLGAALEAATDASYPALLQEVIADPLGLRSLTVDDPRRVIDDRVGHYDRARDGTLGRAPWVDPSYKTAGAGLLADPADLAAFGLALLNGRLLSDSARAELFRPTTIRDGSSTGVALGWRTGADPFGRHVLHHEGSMPGARSALLLYPDEGRSVAVLSNLTAAPFFVFESASAMAALARDDGAVSGAQCLPDGAGEWNGTASMDGVPAEARLRLEPSTDGIRGGLRLGSTPLPVSREIPVVEGWCRDGRPLVVLAVGPNWGLVPVALESDGGGWAGEVELQGGHAFALRLGPSG